MKSIFGGCRLFNASLTLLLYHSLTCRLKHFPNNSAAVVVVAVIALLLQLLILGLAIQAV